MDPEAMAALYVTQRSFPALFRLGITAASPVSTPYRAVHEVSSTSEDFIESRIGSELVVVLEELSDDAGQ
jgi:hypothetical protein